MGQSANQNKPEPDLAGLRDAAVRVVKQLVDAGRVAYFAGGCVRDRLMGIEPTDYDVATDATPDQVAAIFRRVQTVGKAFGVMLVRLGEHEIQVATFRTEGEYSDGRHPDSVEFTDAQHDASRRDFTINGLFENPLTAQVIDYVGGEADLKARIVRAIGDPHARLGEDRLRMLRAVRFMARFSFQLDPDTADAIRANAHELKGVSRDRIGQEIRRMLSVPNREVAAWEMQYLGLDTVVLMEPNRMVAPTRVGRLPDDATYPTALAAWLLDRHAESDADLQSIAERWSDALVASNEERAGVCRALEVYSILTKNWDHVGVAKQKRLAATTEFNQGLLLLQATDRQAFVDVRRRVIDLAKSGLSPDPLIDGNDLIQMGLLPGPAFSRVLEAVYDAQLEGAVNGREDALSMARAVAATPPPR